MTPRASMCNSYTPWIFCMFVFLPSLLPLFALCGFFFTSIGVCLGFKDLYVNTGELLKPVIN